MTPPGRNTDPTGRSGRRRWRRAWLVLIALLYALSIPWYRDTEAPLRLWGGLPDWVAVALGCYVAAAVANVLAWRATELDEVEPPGVDPES